MNGLELILQKIEEDGNAEAEKIKSDAQKTAEKIIADATEKANAEALKIIANGDKKANMMLENAKSGCASLIKRAESFAKAEIVSDCIKIAKKELNEIPDEEYFEIIEKLILKYSHTNEQGELLMNERNIKRMPKGFLKKFKELELCKNPLDIEGGFVIRYGGVEENCTFSSIIEENTEKIKDKLYGLLWEV